MTNGYVGYEELNEDLQARLAKLAPEMSLVQSVNHRLPDETGNVATDFQIIQPMTATSAPTDYPTGNSEFIGEFTEGDGSGWVDAINHDRSTTRAVGTKRFLVKTHVDVENSVFLQEIDDNEDGIFEAVYYRSSSDGITWGETKRVSRLKTINGIAPDDDYNIELPLATWSNF